MAERSLELLEDWEDWDPESGTTFFIHAVAGSFAGGAEHCAMFPVDTIKTHLQAARTTQASPVTIVRSLLESQGPLRMWRGVSTMLTACIPAHAAYYSLFEYCKESFGANGDEHAPIGAGLSGAVATVAHDLIMTPMDVCKQRLQLGFYSGPLDALLSVARIDGVRALYLSFPTTLAMNIPYAVLMTSVNESAKRILNPDGVYHVPAYMLSGAIAGGVAAFLTNPLDVVKTRLQTQNLLTSFPNCENVKAENGSSLLGRVLPEKAMFQRYQPHHIANPIYQPVGISGIRGTYTLPFNSNTLGCICKGEQVVSSKIEGSGRHMKYNSFTGTFRQILQEEGVRGFTRGALSRVLVHAPSVAISWTTYETVKNYLKTR